MSKRILLSICIPTYNRPAALKRLLTGIVAQISDEVEIVIGDDGEFATTQKILEEFKNHNIIHFKNLNDPSFSTNLLAVVKKSRGEYVWLFGDDDELLPGAIPRVLELIKKYSDISFVWANYDFDDFASHGIQHNDGFFKNGNEVLGVIGRTIGFMSSLIFRRQNCVATLPSIEAQKKGLSFIHLALILSVISSDGRFYFLRDPCVLCHPTTQEELKSIATKTGKIRNSAFETFGIDFYDVVMPFNEKFKNGSIRRLLKNNFSSVWRGVAVAWVGGWDTPSGKRWKMFKLYWSYPEIWLALFVFALPLSVNRFFYRIYKIFFDHRKWSFGKTSVSIKNSIT